MISLTQKIFKPITSAAHSSFLYISWDSDNITVRNEKHIQTVICASEILYHIQSISSTILPTWLVYLFVSICKSECTDRLKLQFFTFSTSFNLKWYAEVVLISTANQMTCFYMKSNTELKWLKQPYIEKNLLCYAIVCHLHRGRGFGKTMIKSDIRGKLGQKIPFCKWRIHLQL